jgi:hypothetical protein
MTSADRLRAAAGKIRETAEPAWDVDTSQAGWHTHDGMAQMLSNAEVAWPSEDAAHIALWSPPVALAVADLMDDVAADKDSGLATIHPRLLDLANLILGGAS